MMIDRRDAARSRLHQSASVVFNGRQSVMACTLRNRSSTGAMLRMSDWIALPATFEIDLGSDGESLPVRQCWRRGDDVGVAFLAPEERPSSAPVSLTEFRARAASRRAGS